MSKLTLRDWTAADMPKLASMHEQMQVGYPLPEMSPLFFIKKAVVDSDGRVIAMATVKLVGEAYIFLDQNAPKLKQAKSVKILNEECAKVASAAGLSEVSCWVPDAIAKCFSSILEKLGWQRSRWASWSISLR